MPDISMCANKRCSQAETCYRFRAEPNPFRQAYADFQPNEDGTCQYYWSIEGYTHLRPFEKAPNENHRS